MARESRTRGVARPGIGRRRPAGGGLELRHPAFQSFLLGPGVGGDRFHRLELVPRHQIEFVNQPLKLLADDGVHLLLDADESCRRAACQFGDIVEDPVTGLHRDFPSLSPRTLSPADYG